MIMKKTIQEYLLITFGTVLMAIGVYLFKFPNHFAFGGATGIATVIEALTDMNASDISFVINLALLIFGCLTMGKDFGAKTFYASALFTVLLSIFERLLPLSGPLTHQPILELIYAIALPAAGSAILFRLDASSGGTDIIAMLLKRNSSLNIGIALLLTDLLIAFSSFLVFDVETGLFSLVGLVVKSLIIDSLIASMNMNKYFTIICDDPTPIVEFINSTLHHGSTVTGATGSYTGSKKTIIYAAVKKKESVRLIRYVKSVEPHAFLFVTNSSEIIGKGFLKYEQ